LSIPDKGYIHRALEPKSQELNLMPHFWLMKSEPDVFSIDDLKIKKKSHWDGVRNYQARNFMMNSMSVGDLILFYHSNAQPPGIAGLAKVSGKAIADPTQFNKKSDAYDPKASLEKPRWYCVEVEFLEKFKNFISLSDLRLKKELSDLMVIKKGQRLSIQPVSEKDFEFIKKWGQSH
jgi:predicted RNA-binding protein with PUA-like domain